MNRLLAYRRTPVFLYLVIIAGTGLLAFAIKCIFDPIGLVTGGFTGISILMKDLSEVFYPGGIPLWFANLALNLPVFLLAWKIKGKRFIGRTAIATALLSGWLYVLPELDFISGDYILAALFGGTISGIAMGMILWADATTGGTEMVGALIQCRLKHYSVAQIMQVLDAAVVLAGAWIFGLQYALYAVIAVFVVAKVTDGILEGMKFSKLAYIISEKPEEIAAAVMKEMERGVTGLNGKGMYSGSPKNVLICVVSKKEIVQVKDIVSKIDNHSFVIVTDAREVLGEGFIEYTQ